MGELVKYIAMNLVDKPEEVKVEVKEGETSTVIELSVAPEDLHDVFFVFLNGRDTHRGAGRVR